LAAGFGILTRFIRALGASFARGRSEILFLFPGQGSQYRAWAPISSTILAVRDLYARASAIVGYDMAELSFRDPREELGRTRFTQPALLTHHVACLERSRAWSGTASGRSSPRPSLGEYTALVMAGALTFEAALKLVKPRGELMSELGRGGMLATTLDLPTAHGARREALLRDRRLEPSRPNGGRGRQSRLGRARGRPRGAGKRAGVRLNTEGAFHTYLMVGAAQQFRPELERTEFGSLAIGVPSKLTGKLHEPGAAIRSRLFFQLFNPVRWVDCMNLAIDLGIDTWSSSAAASARRRARGQAAESRVDRQEVLERA